jgi:hypothetical protein
MDWLASDVFCSIRADGCACNSGYKKKGESVFCTVRAYMLEAGQLLMLVQLSYSEVDGVRW